jgi:hypothetical protein
VHLYFFFYSFYLCNVVIHLQLNKIKVPIIHDYLSVYLVIIYIYIYIYMNKCLDKNMNKCGGEDHRQRYN